MMVDLNQMDFRQAKELIDWCVENRVDYDYALRLWNAWIAQPGDDDYTVNIDWILDIPEAQMTYFRLKWS